MVIPLSIPLFYVCISTTAFYCSAFYCSFFSLTGCTHFPPLCSYLENTGSSTNPTFTMRKDKNPFYRLHQVFKSCDQCIGQPSCDDCSFADLTTLSFADADADGDMDLIVGYGKRIIYLEYDVAEDFFFTDAEKTLSRGGAVTNDLRYTKAIGQWDPFSQINSDIGEGSAGLYGGK